MATRRRILALMAGLPALSLLACGRDQETAIGGCSPVPLSEEHECALCGMTIVRFPGPKGQACLRDGSLLTFCSVHDLLAWAWQPESTPAIASLHVHDLSRTAWEEPSEDAYIDAYQAVYVVGHDRRGAMGHSPAPFSDISDARTFAEHRGGQVTAFADMGFESLRGSDGGMRTHDGPGH